ncbi:MAG: Fe-hydrogenase large subunit family protein [Candidatus Melainabacteria bacterium]|nr:MAG: Fe-hydrogenase large subunit family protein [Candidatus Melainabacteria bacterium]
MNNTGNSIHLKKEILIRLVKAFFSEDFEKKTRLIPFDMRPKGAEVPYRCCIYKERAILKDRVIAGLGFAIEDDDETVSLSEYAKKSLDREKPEENPLTVLGAACKGCVPKRIFVTDLCQGCVARPCKSTCKFGAIDVVNGKSVIDSSKCKACKMCISACPYNAIVKVAVPCEDNCPVNAIEKNEDGTARIDFEKCISCGRCVSACPFGAVHEKSQLIEVLKMLKNKEEITLMFAPAIVGQFPGSVGQLKSAIRKVGFTNVYEVAQGADITTVNEAEELKERLDEGQDFMTTSCCAGYNEFIKKHLPEIKPYESTTKTPLYYTAEIAKREHPNAKTVFVSPCVAKKREAQENENVDYVLNAEELGALFIGLQIEIMNCEESEEDISASKQGRNFAVSGGVANAVDFCANCEVKPVVINGINKDTIRQLKKYAQCGKCEEGNLVEVMCCEGGCIRGNATITDTKTAKKLLNELSEKSEDIKRKD